VKLEINETRYSYPL